VADLVLDSFNSSCSVEMADKSRLLLAFTATLWMWQYIKYSYVKNDKWCFILSSYSRQYIAWQIDGYWTRVKL